MQRRSPANKAGVPGKLRLRNRLFGMCYDGVTYVGTDASLVGERGMEEGNARIVWQRLPYHQQCFDHVSAIVYLALSIERFVNVGEMVVDGVIERGNVVFRHRENVDAKVFVLASIHGSDFHLWFSFCGEELLLANVCLSIFCCPPRVCVEGV